MLKASVYCSMEMNFFLDVMAELTAPIRILKVKSSTSWCCKVDRSMNSPDQIFSFFFKDRVACKGTREEMNCWLFLDILSALSDDDIGGEVSNTIIGAIWQQDF